jgi:tRNA uracil 4-sulfurtransferase
MKSIVIHYQEIALKGRNRPWFINRLVRHLRAALADLDVQGIRSLMGRIEVVLGPATSYEEAGERLQHVFGIANFSRAGRTEPTLDAITAAVLRDIAGRTPASFRVTARRADKRFPHPSPEIERHVGGAVKAAFGWPVDLKRPDLTIHIEVVTSEAFYFFAKERGAGGLPSGVSGRVLCLLSGGIDSPVAAWRMMRRGCNAQLVHFHSYPLVEGTSREKVRDIAAILARYQQRVRLYQVPFADVQRRIVVSVPPALRVVLYRRFMLRIAERIAGKNGARALVTGEVVGQVASQTLENMAVIASVTDSMVLRPLVGLDKEEITLEAQRIGTYETSIIPDQDCCQLFTPRYPVTRARPEEIAAAESVLPVDELVRTAADQAIVEDFQARVACMWDPAAPGLPQLE